MSEQIPEGLFIEALYDAAADPRHIDAALEHFVAFSRGHGAAIFIGGTGPDDPVEGVWNWGFPDDAERIYMDGYVEHDLPRLRVFHHEADRWHDVSTFATPEEINRNPYFREFLPRVGTRTLAGARIHYGGGQLMTSLHRGPRNGEFTTADLKALDRLSPHFRRFARLRRILGETANKAALMEQALQTLQTAILIIGQRERIDFASASAELLLGQSDGVMVRGGRLTISDAGTHGRFRRFLTAALSRNAPGAHGAIDLRIPRSSGRSDYHMTLLPLGPGSAYVGRTGAPKVMVIITDPDAPLNLSPGRLAALFGLSPAEARLAHALGSGMSLEEMSDRFRVARSTLRTQLLSTFTKTGTSRQADLVRLLANMPPDQA